MLLVTLVCAEFAWVGFQLNWTRQRHAAFASGASASWLSPSNLRPTRLRFCGSSERWEVAELWCEKDTPENLDTLRRLFPEAKIHEWPDDPDAISFRAGVFRLSKDLLVEPIPSE